MLFNRLLRDFEAAQDGDLRPIIRGLEHDVNLLTKKMFLTGRALVMDQPSTVDMEDIYAHNTTELPEVPIFAIAN